MPASVTDPDDLARLAARISEWRTAHPDRTQPLPAALWQEIAPLRDRYPDQRLCRALHISTHSLRKHGGGASRHQPHPRPTGPCFVPLPAAPEALTSVIPAAPPEAVIRLALERPDGTRLSLHLPAPLRTELASVLANLLRL
jgi:hypothetical protein